MSNDAKSARRGPWHRHHNGWWDNMQTRASIVKTLDNWWLMPFYGTPKRFKSLAAAIKAANEKGQR